MKASINTILFFSYTALAAVASVSPDTRVKSLCGTLGVMEISPKQLPDGVALTDIRMCADHPLGRNRTLDTAEGASLAPMDTDDVATADIAVVPVENTLEERACYKNAPYGCSDGYCWKACGDTAKGEWCWTAGLGGAGSWAKCSSWNDCGTGSVNYGCGKGCAKPFVCGCSC
ncbi:hypothetical protein B0J13DRAFT_304629 [Dactylonectria estremocensis]|uniref:Uncharacterized protein n=1 Tax=Dactylonectria estremocensis TaxID=1079267 RepID=A0A9P9F0B6_9HYPO|nr:hypothetical protein B0J13DRAFT_304629 [Dactylonectria estremocensis]